MKSSKPPPPPDYTPVAEANKYAADLQARQAELNRELSERNAEKNRQLLDRQHRENLELTRTQYEKDRELAREQFESNQQFTREQEEARRGLVKNIYDSNVQQITDQQGRNRQTLADQSARVTRAYKPWTDAGTWAINQLKEGVERGDFDLETFNYKDWEGFGAEDMKDDPGYQFRLQESTRALERSVSASRGVGSGASAKALARYTQDYASNEFAQARGRALQDYMVGRENYTMGLDSRNQATMNRFGQISGLAAGGLQAVGSREGMVNQLVGQQVAANSGLAGSLSGVNMNYMNQESGANQNYTNNMVGLGNAYTNTALGLNQNYLSNNLNLNNQYMQNTLNNNNMQTQYSTQFGQQAANANAAGHLGYTNAMMQGQQQNYANQMAGWQQQQNNFMGMLGMAVSLF